MTSTIESLKAKAIATRGLGSEDALELYEKGSENLFALLSAASEIREYFKGKTVSLCAIINAKSGRCAENCAFCAQSAHHSSDAPVYPLVSANQYDRNAKKAREDGAQCSGHRHERDRD